MATTLPNTIEIGNPSDVLEPQSTDTNQCKLNPVRLPIKPSVKITLKKEAISVSTVKKEIKKALAKFFKEKKSFTPDVKKSDIVDAVKNSSVGKNIIDDVEVKSPPVNIVGKKDQTQKLKEEILKSGDANKSLKDKFVKFTPTFVHFDLDTDLEISIKS
jgi:hypothetical protein